MIYYVKKDLSSLYNLGDDYCTPDRYFKITADRNISIIGGGAYVDHGLKKCKKIGINPSSTIAWGLGSSEKNLKIEKINSLPYLDWSLRDIDAVKDPLRFVPCVSCFNRSILQEPKSNNTLIFLNESEKVSGNIEIDSSYITNSSNIDNFLEQWKSADKIITNSYHGMYWALLSGRSVFGFGYSSKFSSLFKMFDLEFPKENIYKIKNKTDFSTLLNQNLKDPKYISIKNYKIYLDRFRMINFEFARGLKKFNVECELYE